MTSGLVGPGTECEFQFVKPFVWDISAKLNACGSAGFKGQWKSLHQAVRSRAPPTVRQSQIRAGTADPLLDGLGIRVVGQGLQHLVKEVPSVGTLGEVQNTLVSTFISTLVSALA